MYAGFRLILLGLLLLRLACGMAAAADERRVALVIGNSTYRTAPALQNTLNDAKDVAAALRRIGFEVIDGLDLDKRGMDAALTRFARQVRDADAAFFYFAGHGLQFKGTNYLIPVEAKIEDEISLQYEMTKIDDVIAALSYAKGVRILVLDACRNNPFAPRLAQAKGSSRDVGVERGLARIERSQGMLIAYATQANDVAADGSGRNSPFAAALLEEIQQPGLEIASVFRRVQTKVYQATLGKQTPELSMSLLGEFYLNREETDADVWRGIRASNDPAAFRAFMARFPASYLADAARARLDLLERGAAETVERDRLAREFAERERALKEQLDRAEKGRRQAAEELAIRDRADKERRAERPPEPLPAGPLPGSQAPAAPAAPVPPPAQTAQEKAAERERLAEELARRERELVALEDAKQRLNRERVAVERAMMDRLRGGEVEPGAAGQAPRQDRLQERMQERVQERVQERLQEQRVQERVPVARDEARPQAAPNVRNRKPAACAEMLMRAQLGDLSDAERVMLQQC